MEGVPHQDSSSALILIQLLAFVGMAGSSVLAKRGPEWIHKQIQKRLEKRKSTQPIIEETSNDS